MIKLIGNIGNAQIFKQVSKLESMTKKQIHRAFHEIGQEHVNYVADLMSEKKTGHIYIIKGIEHQASAPGEAPAIRSRQLINSLFYNVSGHTYLEFGLDTRYAGYLEDGTKPMAARPSLLRAVIDKERDTYNSLLQYLTYERMF